MTTENDILHFNPSGLIEIDDTMIQEEDATIGNSNNNNYHINPITKNVSFPVLQDAVEHNPHQQLASKLLVYTKCTHS